MATLLLSGDTIDVADGFRKEDISLVLQTSEGRESRSAPCRLVYEQNRMLVVGRGIRKEGPQQILDRIDPEDVLGCRVEASEDNNNNDGDDNSAFSFLRICTYPTVDKKKKEAPKSTWWCGTGKNKTGTFDASTQSTRTDESGTSQQERLLGTPPPLEATTGATKEARFSKRYAKQYRFQFPSHQREMVNALVRSIRAVSGCQAPGSRCFWIVMNPKAGGRGVAKQMEIYRRMVEPMLQQAGIRVHELLVTTHRGHATERVTSNFDEVASTCNGILSLGGDGTFNEVLQGIKARPDALDILSRFTFGVVPMGTSNGMNKSIAHACHESYGIMETLFLVGKGWSRSADLAFYQSSVPSSSYWGFLTFSYALVADLDKDSDSLRCLGSWRNDIFAVWKIMRLRSYRIRFSYLSESEAQDGEELPALSDPIPSHWKTIEDDVVLFWPCQVTHAAYNVMQTPMCRLDDGVFHVAIVRKCRRHQLLKLFLNIENGAHMEDKSNIVEVHKCVAWRLEPLGSSRSYNDVDGEMIEDGPVQAHILPSAFQVFGRPA